MKKICKSVLALALASVIALLCCSGAFAAFDENDSMLKFNDDGKFKIVVFADTQDDFFPDQRMIDMINYALDAEKPDLVVFTGDNVVQSGKLLNAVAIRHIVEPVVSRGIPFAYTFGNHDGERCSKEAMHDSYVRTGGKYCLTTDPAPEITGFGTCSIPLYSSASTKDNKDIVFNFWMIDSNMYDRVNGGYDYVHEDQIEWFKNEYEAIKAEAGKDVNSIAFQHIVVPEVYNCLVSTSEKTDKTYLGVNYKLELNENADGELYEWPCPPNSNHGEFEAFKENGHVLGIVTGHDHVNSFEGAYDGIRFSQIPGMSYQSYGNDKVRGYGVLVLNENDLSMYGSSRVTYSDVQEPRSKSQLAKDSFNMFFKSLGMFFNELFSRISGK